MSTTTPTPKQLTPEVRKVVVLHFVNERRKCRAYNHTLIRSMIEALGHTASSGAINSINMEVASHV